MRTQASPRIQSRKAIRCGAESDTARHYHAMRQNAAGASEQFCGESLRAETFPRRKPKLSPVAALTTTNKGEMPTLPHDAGERAGRAGVEFLGHAAGKKGLTAGLNGVAHGRSHQDGVLRL